MWAEVIMNTWWILIPVTILWAQDVNWAYIRRLEDVQDVFWMSYVHAIYVLCPRGTQIFQGKDSTADRYGLSLLKFVYTVGSKASRDTIFRLKIISKHITCLKIEFQFKVYFKVYMSISNKVTLSSFINFNFEAVITTTFK